MDWIKVSQDRAKWQTVAKKAVTFGFHKWRVIP